MPPLRQPDGDRRAGGQLGDELLGRARRASAAGTARWIIPHAAASAPLTGPAEQQQLLGPGDADEPGHQPGGAAVGREARAW